MPKYRVQLKIEDNFTVEVEAEDEDDADNQATEIIAQLEDPANSEFFDGSSGIEVWNTEELP